MARGELPADQALANDDFSVRWTGQLVPPVSRTLRGDGHRRRRLPPRRRRQARDRRMDDHAAGARAQRVPRPRGRPAATTCGSSTSRPSATPRSAWAGSCPAARSRSEEALDAARAADVVVFVGGLTGDVEGEEMAVSYPGFAGGDRTDLALPSTQDKLLRALQATGKPVVLVLMTGSAHRRRMGPEERPGHRGRLVPGPAGRQRRRGRAVRRRQPLRPAARSRSTARSSSCRPSPTTT